MSLCAENSMIGTPSGSVADVLVLSQLNANETAYWPVAVNTQ